MLEAQRPAEEWQHVCSAMTGFASGMAAGIGPHLRDGHRNGGDFLIGVAFGARSPVYAGFDSHEPGDNARQTGAE
jgi:hypothetical protein